jgi:hypothetical protein
MRQGQHPKKNRGRNRRQPNPVNRVYESNGPDVKIRGNAALVSEKYLTLARDAQSSGDPISYENYLQHAEHYLRIIAAANTQQQQQQAQADANEQRNGGGEDSRQDSRQPRERGQRRHANGASASQGENPRGDVADEAKEQEADGGDSGADVEVSSNDSSETNEPREEAEVVSTTAQATDELEEEVRDAS